MVISMRVGQRMAKTPVQHDTTSNAKPLCPVVRDAAAHYNLAVALYNQGDWNGAMAEYGEALRLDPNDATAHTNIAAALAGKGDRAVCHIESAMTCRVKCRSGGPTTSAVALSHCARSTGAAFTGGRWHRQERLCYTTGKAATLYGFWASAFSTASGFRAITVRYARTALSGCLRPCSHSCKERGLTA